MLVRNQRFVSGIKRCSDALHILLLRMPCITIFVSCTVIHLAWLAREFEVAVLYPYIAPLARSTLLPGFILSLEA